MSCRTRQESFRSLLLPVHRCAAGVKRCDPDKSAAPELSDIFIVTRTVLSVDGVDGLVSPGTLALGMGKRGSIAKVRQYQACANPLPFLLLFPLHTLSIIPHPQPVPREGAIKEDCLPDGMIVPRWSRQSVRYLHSTDNVRPLPVHSMTLILRERSSSTVPR